VSQERATLDRTDFGFEEAMIDEVLTVLAME
jgi:hypothetical protein